MPVRPSLSFRLASLLGLLLGLAPLAEPATPAVAARYDLIVYGATPGGLACAVRAAREGLAVLVVSPHSHLGGLLANGLSTMDTLYNGARSPLYDELRAAIHDHYRTTYGADSEQYRYSLPGNPKTKFEAHVVERLITGMFEREKNITLVRRFHPVAVARTGALLESVTFRALGGPDGFTVAGFAFADCSYEGDLAAVAGVPYRVGRESREEFGEEHAGRIFMTHAQWPPPAHVDPAYIADYRRLNLVHYQRWYDIIRPASTGAADGTVQAYNLRTVITNDPANRLPAEKPAGYDREALLRRLQTDINWSTSIPKVGQPNRKAYLNLPEIVGAQRDYPEGDWAVRQRIWEEHAFATRALLYFMQNDPSVPEATRAGWREWGLPRDEFADNGHLPYEIYVREARRIDGRARFTEHDARLAPGLRRAPIHRDAITITEWFLDSHACTPERVEGSMYEGELLLNHITFPGQVSYRTLLPEGLDNLLVPVCASSSHIGWGAIRLEPTWMSLAEAAAHATVLGLRSGAPPARIDPDRLVRLLAERGAMVSFFNDVEVDPREPWWAAVQYLGTQGFFGSYEADPLDAVTEPVAAAWAVAAAEWVRGQPVDPNERARHLLAAEQSGGPPVTTERFLAMLSEAFAAASVGHSIPDLKHRVPLAPDIRLNRGNACRLIYAAGN
ncbi:MAG: FAD-dependent oxidoreductase [Opitutaceae bacterium]|nr:FAD-dependent oxidoreductase [Opitutaceae bacterium]